MSLIKRNNQFYKRQTSGYSIQENNSSKRFFTSSLGPNQPNILAYWEFDQQTLVLTKSSDAGDNNIVHRAYARDRNGLIMPDLWLTQSSIALCPQITSSNPNFRNKPSIRISGSQLNINNAYAIVWRNVAPSAGFHVIFESAVPFYTLATGHVIYLNGNFIWAGYQNPANTDSTKIAAFSNAKVSGSQVISVMSITPEIPLANAISCRSNNFTHTVNNNNSSASLGGVIPRMIHLGRSATLWHGDIAAFYVFDNAMTDLQMSDEWKWLSASFMNP